MLLLWDNAIGRATIDAPGWTYPDRMRQRPLSVRAWSADAAPENTRISLTWVRPEPVRGLVLCGHTGSRTGTMIVRFWADGARTGLLQEIEVPMARPAGEMSWPEYGWWMGVPMAAEQQPLRAYLSADIGVEAVDIEILDAGNPDGRIGIGYIMVGRGFSPGWGYAHGSSIAPSSTERVEVTEGGIELGTDGQPVRVATIDLPDLSADDAWKRLWPLLLKTGRTKDVWLDLDPTGATPAPHFLARMPEPDGLTWQPSAEFSTRQTFKEVL